MDDATEPDPVWFVSLGVSLMPALHLDGVGHPVRQGLAGSQRRGVLNSLSLQCRVLQVDNGFSVLSRLAVHRLDPFKKHWISAIINVCLNWTVYLSEIVNSERE